MFADRPLDDTAEFMVFQRTNDGEYLMLCRGSRRYCEMHFDRFHRDLMTSYEEYFLVRVIEKEYLG